MEMRGFLQVVLENLIANAWKFTGKKPVVRIELGALLQKDGADTVPISCAIM